MARGIVTADGTEREVDVIVFGTGLEGEARKASGQPILQKRITGELGNVSPVIVVPGPWSEPDLAFQAAHIATMKMHNAGANCIAAQILVTSQTWSLAPAFVERVRDALRDAPGRPSYYPGSEERRAQVAATPPAPQTPVPPGGGAPRSSPVVAGG